MAVPNIFANVTTSIPLSQLDTNFATAITLGNTAVYLGNTTTTLGNLTLTNVTLSSGTNNIGSTSISNGTSNVSIASSGGNITMATGGSNAVIVTTGQNVGIGTTTPARKLEVSAGGSVAARFTGTNPVVEWVCAGGTNTNFMLAAQSNVGDGFEITPSTAAGGFTFSNPALIVKSDGKVTVGTSAQSKGNLNIFGASNTQTNLYLFKNGQVEAYMGFNTSDTNLYVNSGATFATNGVYMVNGGTSWVTNSDERLKENLVPITDAITKVSSLRTVIGNFIADEYKTARPFLIAQDVQAVLPEAVSTSTMNETEYLGVSYTDVIPLLVASIKELKSQNDALTARIVALETNNGA
jgi:hypothetical protein